MGFVTFRGFPSAQPADASRRRVPLVSLPFKVLSVGSQAAGDAEAARAMRCEPPTFSGTAREREACLPANVGQRAKMQELTRRDERGSCLTCCRCQGSPAAEAADETDTGAFMRVSALRRAALHEHGATPTNLCAEASGWSATRAREQSAVPKHSAPSSELEQPLSCRERLATLPPLRAASRRASLSDVSHAEAYERRAVSATSTGAVAPSGLQGFEQTAESVPNARSVTRARRPILSWPYAPPGYALAGSKKQLL